MKPPVVNVQTERRKALADRVRFGRFELQVTEGRLLVDGEPATLGRRAFDLLQVLVERAGSLVTRDELIERVWPHVVVEENNLNVQVNALRRVLGADVVLTVPGRGYRLALKVEPLAPPAVPAASPAAPPRTHLPVGLGPLIGRDDVLAETEALLEGSRLVSVVGAGGVGKSRLAHAVLQRRAPRQPGAVCWVDLHAAADAQSLPGAIGVALGLERAPGDPVASLVKAAAGLDLLVALDGGEVHLDAVAGLVQRLLDGVGGLSLLVTSQAPLRLGAERVVRLQPLRLPAPGDDIPAMRRAAAVALFEDRARAADSRFALTDAQVPAAAAVCRRLDGLPLAIELAAARAPMMGVAVLLDSLDDRLRVLTASRNRLAPPRQQTLRGALQWSYGLLGSMEQMLFRHMGVLAGSAPLALVLGLVPGADAAAQAQRWDLLDALDQLVQRSLVDAVSDETGQSPRYRLLESPRALAVEELRASGEEPQARRCHAMAVLSEFEQSRRSLLAGAVSVEAWRRDVLVLLADLQQALSWALAAGDDPLALALARALLDAVPDPRHVETRIAVQTCERVLASHADLEPRLACNAWLVVSLVGVNGPQRRPEATERALARARQLGPGDDDRFLLYLVLCEAARALQPTSTAERIRALLKEARTLEAPDWPPIRTRARFRAEAFVAMRNDRADDALRWLQRALELSLAAGDPSLATRLNIADMELLAGDAAAAIRTGTSLVAALAERRAAGLLALARINLAAAHLARDQADPARSLLQLAWTTSRAFGADWPHNESCLVMMALLVALEGRHETAAQLLGAAETRNAGAGFALNEKRAWDRCSALVTQALGEAQALALRAQRRGLHDDALTRLAFGT